jgi:predicted DNA binding protein
MTSTCESEYIRTEIELGVPEGCPVAQVSADADTRISQVTRSSGTTAEGMLTEEFTLDADASFDQSDVETVFEYDSQRVYRFEREQDRGCVCEYIEQYGCPVSDIRAHDGMLVVSFYAPDIETVQEIVTGLHDRYNEIHVRQLTRADEQREHDFIFLDRERLTGRQREVLEMSFEMGYFDHPKRANAGDVAEALDIAPSTFTEHLAAAQRKLLEAILQS